MLLKEVILALLLQHTPVGKTMFSVEAMPECGVDRSAPTCALEPVCRPATAPLCTAPWWSASHGSWARYETYEGAVQRLTVVADAIAEKTKQLYCVGDDGRYRQGCHRIHWGWDGRRNTGTFRELVMSELTVIIMESGAREDVEMGRGRYKRPVDKGQGRGPGNEACFFQVLPGAAYRFADWLTPAQRNKIALDPKLREAVLQQMLGDTPEALGNCTSVGSRMLTISRGVCEARAAAQRRQMHINPPEPQDPNRTYWWAFGMFSYYGVGPGGAADGCYDSNHGKTLLRVRLLQMLLNTAPAITWEPG